MNEKIDVPNVIKAPQAQLDPNFDNKGGEQS